MFRTQSIFRTSIQWLRTERAPCHQAVCRNGAAVPPVHAQRGIDEERVCSGRRSCATAWNPSPLVLCAYGGVETAQTSDASTSFLMPPEQWDALSTLCNRGILRDGAFVHSPATYRRSGQQRARGRSERFLPAGRRYRRQTASGSGSRRRHWTGLDSAREARVFDSWRGVAGISRPGISGDDRRRQRRAARCSRLLCFA